MAEKKPKKPKTEDEIRYAALTRKERQKVLHMGFRVLDALNELPAAAPAETRSETTIPEAWGTIRRDLRALEQGLHQIEHTWKEWMQQAMSTHRIIIETPVPDT